MNDDTRSISEKAAARIERDGEATLRLSLTTGECSIVEHPETAATPFRPDNTPRPCKVAPREKFRPTKGAFGKCKNTPPGYGVMRFLDQQVKDARLQFFVTGDISQPTREKINRVAGEGAATQVLKHLVGEVFW